MSSQVFTVEYFCLFTIAYAAGIIVTLAIASVYRIRNFGKRERLI
jgi:hypothetical protein